MNVQIQSLLSLPSHNDLFVLSNRLLHRSGSNPTVSQAEIAPSLSFLKLCPCIWADLTPSVYFGGVSQRSLDPGWILCHLRQEEPCRDFKETSICLSISPFLCSSDMCTLSGKICKWINFLHFPSSKEDFIANPRRTANQYQPGRMKKTDWYQQVLKNLFSAPCFRLWSSLMASPWGLGSPLLHSSERVWPVPSSAEQIPVLEESVVQPLLPSRCLDWSCSILPHSARVPIGLGENSPSPAPLLRPLQLL